MTSHDVVQDDFVSITRDERFHILCEQTHVFLPPLTCQQVNIVVLVDGVQTLVNTIITNSIRIHLVLLVVLFCEVVVTIAVEARDGLYHDRYLMD
jgi:hypothetical protein